MIPKNIYQTWKTKLLPPNVESVIQKIQKLNPDYTMHLYDDEDMLRFLQENYTQDVVKAYEMLAVGASKADLWRYCILYTYGEVYLDIDADIRESLDTLVKPDDKAIITREENPGLFCQWILMFEPKHPLLELLILNCVNNILNKVTDNIMFLTGPALFTIIINNYLESNNTNTYFLSDESFNNLYGDKIKVYGIDMGKYASYKHAYAGELYVDNLYWQNEKKTFN